MKRINKVTFVNRQFQIESEADFKSLQTRGYGYQLGSIYLLFPYEAAYLLEIGRVETLRSLGLSYASMEKKGIMLPVVDYSVKYIKPAHYDDLITVRTMIEEIPSVKIKFNYEIYNENDDLLTSAKTTLVFVKKESMRPTNAPQELVTILTSKLLKNKS
mgnify:CR=1 FL=1